ncbi:cytochrome P450 [Roridomyces roridus]|uniref:Cytochrome P450 n=1 Tax=Roridomyces roridus TaxID=1738132 RepID=A0AAD7CBB1_9AGAR|nr:cytochrome P450 [Roridomyces roridus]
MSLFILLLCPVLLLCLLSGFLRLLLRQALSPLKNLRGPNSPSFWMGNLREMHDQENNNLIADWESAYGSTFVYRGFIGGCRLMTTDPVAIAHILANAYDYPKPDFVRDSLATMVAGDQGLLTAEGDAHRRQRKILSPAFSSSHIKSLSPIFWDKANKLREIWLDTSDHAETKCARVDALGWISRATLDAMGLAGFGYNFNSLLDDKNELAQAFGVIFSTARKFRVMTILQVWFPFLRRFRRNNAVMAQAHQTMRRIGLGLIEERSRAVIEEQAQKCGAIQGDKTILGRDILSVLIRSNIATSADQNMSVDEVLCQISTFMAAGHETTSSALTWCLYALVQNPLAQSQLRTALRDIECDLRSECPELAGSEYLEMLTERVSKCEYLDWVIRETLRLHAPITSTMRVCMRDDQIPVDSDALNVDKNGRRLYGIRVKKWDIITIPIQAINKSTALWGEDARAFKPERWARPPPNAAKAIPALYSHMLTFLNGNHACIGYKFALLEMKIFLYTLVKDLEFRMHPSLVIEKRVNVVTRPFVKSAPELGNQLPLDIQRVPAR